MKLYTYGGETAAQALKIAQEKHGEDALVVKTRDCLLYTSDAADDCEPV